MKKKIHTKFGTATIVKGYYVIKTRKEGNHNKFLHRLIWEDFYDCEVPKGYVIHHRNHIKTDNCILNLQLMRHSDHNTLHNTGNTGEKNHNYKPYATIMKKGFNRSGSQRYAINFNGKEMWVMTDKKKLINRFCAEYPLEIIKRR